MQGVQPIQETNRPNQCNLWTMACAALLLCIAAAIAASAQTFTTLADFPSSDRSPTSPLVQGLDGNFYGFANGGVKGDQCQNQFCGAMFRVTSAGKITILHTFCSLFSCLDGWGPSSLVLGGDGNFYGVTYGGGANTTPPCNIDGCGTIFKITPGGTLTTLYNFSCSATSCADGSNPISLMQSFNSGGGSVYSDFYGTTFYTAFRVTPRGQLTTLYTFCSQPNCADGYLPGTLTQAAGGNFFGAARQGLVGTNCNNACGNIFRMTPTGTLKTLYRYTVPMEPNTPLVEGANGSYYTTTASSMIAITAQGKLTNVYNFCTQTNCPDGSDPSALILPTDGNFYGAMGSTFMFGAQRSTLFRVTQSGAFSVLYTFCAQTNCADGSGSAYALVQGTDGKFYGTTADGGSTVCPSGCGTFFSLDVGLAPFVRFLVGTGKVGQTVGILGQGFTGTTAVSLNGTPATFTVKSDTYLTAVVPSGATTGSVTVTTLSGTLTSNVAYRVTR